jgi:DHA1 family 2-module integral membrane pump EmrD-like MFS transporter
MRQALLELLLNLTMGCYLQYINTPFCRLWGRHLRDDPHKNIIYYSGLLISAWLLGLAGESIYAPAMPSIASELHVSETWVKLTITYFIFGKTISMFLCSPIAEVFGRRQFILFGLVMFVFGGFLCAGSQDIHLLLSGRVIQGLGCSIIILMGRAIVNDCFQGGYAAKVFSYIFTGNAIGIFFLPILGGYMATYVGWRWIFLVLSIYGSVIFMIMWKFLPQTNPKISLLANIKPRVIFNNYLTLLRSSYLWGFLFCLAFMMAGEKAYTTSAAFFFIQKVGFSSIQYGYLTAAIWAAHLSGTLFSGWLALRAGIERVLNWGVMLISFASIVLLVLGFTGFSSVGIFISAMLIYMFSTGFIIVSSAVGIVRPFPNLIGFATAFAMAFEFAISFISSFLISFHASSLITIAKMVGIMGILTFLAWLLFLHYNYNIKKL